MQRIMTPTLTHTDPIKRSMALGMKRGMKMRCPNCGEGKLYRKYLKVQDCPVCGNENSLYPADDAPPYFTILIVGHLVVAPLLFFPFIWRSPTWLVLGTTLPALLALTMLFLPVVKGAVVGAHWALKPRRAVEDL
ncbi:MAG: zinc-finger protein [Caulobacteraceae bacterium]|nr:zinc-finger protein [Caulobacteraceae bacterium]